MTSLSWLIICKFNETYKLNFEGNQIESHLVGLPMVLQMFSGIIVYDYATCNVMSIGMDASRNITVSNQVCNVGSYEGTYWPFIVD